MALDSRVETLVKKRVALGLEYEALSWDRHGSRHRVPIANEILRSIDSGQLDPSLDVEAMIDLYYYQFIIRGRSTKDEDETRARMRQP